MSGPGHFLQRMHALLIQATASLGSPGSRAASLAGTTPACSLEMTRDVRFRQRRAAFGVFFREYRMAEVAKITTSAPVAVGLGSIVSPPLTLGKGNALFASLANLNVVQTTKRRRRDHTSAGIGEGFAPDFSPVWVGVCNIRNSNARCLNTARWSGAALKAVVARPAGFSPRDQRATPLHAPPLSPPFARAGWRGRSRSYHWRAGRRAFCKGFVRQNANGPEALATSLVPPVSSVVGGW